MKLRALGALAIACALSCQRADSDDAPAARGGAGSGGRAGESAGGSTAGRGPALAGAGGGITGAWAGGSLAGSAAGHGGASAVDAASTPPRDAGVDAATTSTSSGCAGIADLVACDDFENGTVGKPIGAPWQEKNYCQCAGFSPTYSAAQAFSGTKSIQLNGPAGTPGAHKSGGDPGHPQGAFRLLLTPNLDVVYARMMMWIDRKVYNHWTFAEVETYSDGPNGPADLNTSNDYAIRFGQQVQERSDGLRRFLMNNLWENGGESAFEDTDPTHDLPLSKWICVEMRFDRKAALGELWIDGVAMTAVSKPFDLHQSIPGAWKSMVFGMENYDPSDAVMFVDDVAVARSRIGCPRAK